MRAWWIFAAVLLALAVSMWAEKMILGIILFWLVVFAVIVIGGGRFISRRYDSNREEWKS